MVSKQDDVFMREFGVILGLLVIFAFVAYFLGTGIAESAQRAAMATEDETLERIRPVGQVRVAAASTGAKAPEAAAKAAPTQTAAAKPAAPAAKPAASAPKPAAAVASADTEGRSGDTLYQTVCMACHVVGIANAPKTGDTAAWEARAKLGLDALVQSVLKGKGAMPPKAGNPTLTEDEAKRAVQWFLEKAGVNAG